MATRFYKERDLRNDSFWIVWCPTGRTPPQYRHVSEQVARDEARRLASLNPQQEFFVLKATERVYKTDVAVEKLVDPRKQDNEDEIPF